MSGKVSELLRMIREEISLYQELVEHARRKEALLAQADAEAVEHSNKADEAYSLRLRKLESEMRRLCRELGRGYGIPPEECSLERLVVQLEPALALEIRSQSALLRNSVKSLKPILERSRRLAEKSLCHTSGLLALLSNANGSYRQNGLFEEVSPIRPAFSQQA